MPHLISLIGVPTDIGAGARGASMGPEALRVAGLAQVLESHGLEVADRGNLAGPANPFITVPNPALDGPGPNPLLQEHILMAVHPPMLSLGYVGVTRDVTLRLPVRCDTCDAKGAAPLLADLEPIRAATTHAALAEQMGRVTGGTFIVDNKPGANGNLSASRLQAVRIDRTAPQVHAARHLGLSASRSIVGSSIRSTDSGCAREPVADRPRGGHRGRRGPGRGRMPGTRAAAGTRRPRAAARRRRRGRAARATGKPRRGRPRTARPPARGARAR